MLLKIDLARAKALALGSLVVLLALGLVQCSSPESTTAAGDAGSGTPAGADSTDQAQGGATDNSQGPGTYALTWLHTPSEPNQPDSRYPTVVIVHGLNHHQMDPWPKRMADKVVQLIEDENRNQQDDPKTDVLVDDINIAFWYWGYYDTATSWNACYLATPAAGQELARRLGGLMDGGTIDPDPSRIHLIGYSDGGYVCAVCGSSIAARNRGLIGQLTGLDVPDVVIPPQVVQVDPSAFGAVTWYPLVGPDPILSLPLEGRNVIMERVHQEDYPGLKHTNFFDQYYTEQKIEPGEWDSWVAIKDTPRESCLGFERVQPQLNVSYTLESQLGEQEWSDGGEKSFTDFAGREALTDQLFNTGVGSYPAAYSGIDVHGWDYGYTQWEWSVTMWASGWGESAHARTEMTTDFTGRMTTNWQPGDLATRNELATPVLLTYSSTLDLQALSQQQTAPLPACVPPSHGIMLGRDAMRCALIMVGPDKEALTVSGTSTVSATDAYATPYQLGCSLLRDPFRLTVDADGATQLSSSGSAIVCPAETSASVRAPYLLSADVYAVRVQSAARTVWGDPPLTFAPEVSTIQEAHSFTPEIPGLYVIRVTWTSADNGSSASSNAIVFAAGSRE